MSIAIFLSICLPKTCDKSENLDEMCVQLWSLSTIKMLGKGREKECVDDDGEASRKI